MWLMILKLLFNSKISLDLGFTSKSDRRIRIINQCNNYKDIKAQITYLHLEVLVNQEIIEEVKKLISHGNISRGWWKKNLNLFTDKYLLLKVVDFNNSELHYIHLLQLEIKIHQKVGKVVFQNLVLLLYFKLEINKEILHQDQIILYLAQNL